MKIYTRTGDDGTTALFGGGRVEKTHPRVAAYGEVDELNSVLGWALTQISSAETAQRIQVVQHDLFTLGAELATPTGGNPGCPRCVGGRIARRALRLSPRLSPP